MEIRTRRLFTLIDIRFCDNINMSCKDRFSKQRRIRKTIAPFSHIIGSGDLFQEGVCCMPKNDYSAGMVSKPFWFIEFKKVMTLLDKGVDYEEIKRMSIKEPLLMHFLFGIQLLKEFWVCL